MEPERFTSIDFTNFQMFYAWLIPLADEYYCARYWGHHDQSPDIVITSVDAEEVCFKAYYTDKYGELDDVGFDLSVHYLLDEAVRAEVLDQFRIHRHMIEVENQVKAKELADYVEEKERQEFERLKQKFDK